MTMSVIQVGLILIGTFFLLLALSVPVSISLIVSSVLTTACVMDLDLATFVASQKMITGVDSFSLIAVPFFILCGVLMNSGGIAQKLINFAKLFVGFIPGGLAHTNILGSTLFGSISGSSVAASIAVGGFPWRKKKDMTASSQRQPILRLLQPDSSFLLRESSLFTQCFQGVPWWE